MPVEILELIVRAEIQDDQPAADGGNEQETAEATAAGPSMMEVAEQVREIIKRKKER